MLTAVLERASVRNVQRTWCLTLNTLDLFVLIHMNGKLCSQKCLCIRMERVFRNILPRNYLYNISKIHNCDLMSKRTNQRQVMTDKQHTDILFFLKAHKKLDHGFLYRNIQCRGSLITYQNLRFQRKCTCNTDTLSLTTTHVMGITVYKISRKLYHLQKFSGLGFFFTFFQFPIIDQWLCKNVHNLHFRIKRSKRILEYHLHVLTVQPGFLFGKICKIFSMVKDLTAGRLVKGNDHTDKC